MENEDLKAAEYLAKYKADLKRLNDATERAKRLMSNLKDAAMGLSQAMEGRTVDASPREYPTAEEYDSTIQELNGAHHALHVSSGKWDSVAPK
jgi:hypothetical protein